MELYGRGAIVREANGSRRDLNVKGLGALDIRTTKPDGSSWDFTRRADRQEAMALIDELNPDFIIGSPPCTPFCSWNVHMNFTKMKEEDVDRIVTEGKLHHNLMVKVYRKQIAKG